MFSPIVPYGYLLIGINYAGQIPNVIDPVYAHHHISTLPRVHSTSAQFIREKKNPVTEAVVGCLGGGSQQRGDRT